MRHFSYIEQDEEGKPVVVTLSEDEIKEYYYPYWHTEMCKKYGEQHVSDNYCFSDCLDDWAVTHWAIEVTEEE